MTKPLGVMGKAPKKKKSKRPQRRHLRYVGLQPRTLKAYRQALDGFLHYLKKNDILSIKPSKLDSTLSEFINHMFQEGDQLTYAGHLISSIKRFYPQLRLALPITTQFYKNWAKSHVPVRATPASWELVEAMVSLALHREDAPLALLLTLGFLCLLRTSEMMLLTHAHILLHPSGAALSVVIPTSKTSQGNPQVLQVEDAHTVALAKATLLTSRRGKARPLWSRGPHQFRRVFQELLSTLGFTSGEYLPYSLRRGGATWHYMVTLSHDATMVRGRWSCLRTCRQYVDEGTSQLAHLCWSARQVALVRSWRHKGAKLRLRQS